MSVESKQIEFGRFRQDMLERDADGHLIGRDPRDLTAEQLIAAGAEPAILKAVRAKCLDCCCEQPTEVRKCTAVDCALWPYRLGRNPFNRRVLTAEQRVALSDRMKKFREEARTVPQPPEGPAPSKISTPSLETARRAPIRIGGRP